MSQMNSNPLYNRYKKEEDNFLIEIELDNPRHLFDRKDPSPLKGRDLNEDVVTYIINSLREIPHGHSVLLKIYFRETLDDPKFSSEQVTEAIKTFFQFEEYNRYVELRLKITRGLKALVIGLSFLFLCIIFPHLAKESAQGILWLYVREGLNVLGWVSMWYPIHILLYEWWPIKEEIRIIHRAMNMQVMVTYYSKNLSVTTTSGTLA